MVVTYNRRREGETWLHNTMHALMTNFIVSSDKIDMELSPLAYAVSTFHDRDTLAYQF